MGSIHYPRSTRGPVKLTRDVVFINSNDKNK
jgi:hypothetical protein